MYNNKDNNKKIRTEVGGGPIHSFVRPHSNVSTFNYRNRDLVMYDNTIGSPKFLDSLGQEKKRNKIRIYLKQFSIVKERRTPQLKHQFVHQSIF